MPIYFSGVLPPQPEDVDLISLEATDPRAFRELFAAWLVQFSPNGLAVVTDSDALSPTELRELEATFRACDWKIVHGLTAEEVVLWLQLTLRKRLTFVVNEEVPQQPLGRLERVLPISSLVLAACLVRHLSMLRRGTLPVLLCDEGIAHVISAKSVDPSMLWVGYDDQLWRTPAKSVLSRGENSFGIDAQYCGRDDIGQWVTSTAAISKLIYGVPILTDDASTWHQWIADANAQLTER